MNKQYASSIAFRLVAFAVILIASIFSEYNLRVGISLLSLLTLFQFQEKNISTKSKGWFLPFVMFFMTFAMGSQLLIRFNNVDSMNSLFFTIFIGTLSIGAIAGEIEIVISKFEKPNKSLLLSYGAIITELIIIALYIWAHDVSTLRLYLAVLAIGLFSMAIDLSPWEEPTKQESCHRQGRNWPWVSLIFLGIFMVEIFVFAAKICKDAGIPIF